MRIRDWSSDVCSSDLPALKADYRAHGCIDKHPAFAIGHEAKAHVRGTTKLDHTFRGAGSPAIAFERVRQRYVWIVDSDQKARLPLRTVVHHGIENGRATGRERGCTYV